MKRFSLAFLGLLLLFSGTAVFFGAEWVRAGLQRQLSRFLGVPVRIQRVTLLPHRLSMHGVSLQPGSPLRIERLDVEGNFLVPTAGSLTLTGLNLSIAGLPLNAHGRVFLRSAPGSYARVEGQLSLDHPFLRGEVELTGRLLEPVTLGWVEGVHVGRRHFVAQWRIREDSLTLTRMEIQGGWTAVGRLAPSGEAELRLAAAETRAQLKVVPTGRKAARATLWMYREGLLPKEVSTAWELKDRKLFLRAAFQGKSAGLSGSVDLRPPHPMEMTLQVWQLQVEEILKWFQPEVSPGQRSGWLQAELTLEGPARNPEVHGQIRMRQVNWDGLQVESVTAHVEGRAPHLRVEGAVTPQPESVMLMEGRVDLRRVGRPDFLNGVRLNSADHQLELAGWQLGMTPGTSGVFLRPISGAQEPRLGLAYEMDTSVPQEPIARQGLEMEYPISSQESVRYRVEEEEQFFGVEHRKKF